MTKRLSDSERLIDECNQSGVNVEAKKLPENIDAVYYEDKETLPTIVLNELLNTQAEICCVIAEEIGHYHTSCGNLLTDPNTDTTIIQQQETRAKRWASRKLIPMKNIISAYEAGTRNFFEMAEYLNVTEEFLRITFERYASMYGKYKKRGVYTIFFDPPGIFRNI